MGTSRQNDNQCHRSLSSSPFPYVPSPLLVADLPLDTNSYQIVMMTMKLVPIFMQILALRTLKKEKKKKRKGKSLCYLTEFVMTFSIFDTTHFDQTTFGSLLLHTRGKNGREKKAKKKKKRRWSSCSLTCIISCSNIISIFLGKQKSKNYAN